VYVIETIDKLEKQGEHRITFYCHL
jgi:hypothetical protein